MLVADVWWLGGGNLARHIYSLSLGRFGRLNSSMEARFGVQVNPTLTHSLLEELGHPTILLLQFLKILLHILDTVRLLVPVTQLELLLSEAFRLIAE